MEEKVCKCSNSKFHALLIHHDVTFYTLFSKTQLEKLKS